MTCAESRELLSAHLDGALSPDERTALEAHLAGCAECRRERAALESTVALVRAIEPARAPAGFVDRVVTVTRPTPWTTRLARRLFVPWPKIPVEVAALLLVAGLAVMLFRGSEEQQSLARFDRTPPAPAPQQPAPAPQQPAPAPQQPAPAPQQPAPAPGRELAPSPPPVATAREEPAAPSAKLESAIEQRVAAPAEGERAMTERPAPAPSVLDGARAKSDAGAKVQAPVDERAQAIEDKKSAELAKDANKRRDAAPESQSKERAGEPDRFAQRAAKPPAATAPGGAVLGAAAPGPDVSARLRAADVAGAERALVELAGRLGGRQTGRRVDGDLVIVELAVPRDAYDRFVREAGTLGTLSVEQQATERAVLSIAVRVSP